jgi:ABC-2 type transport system permease protein
VWPVAIQLVVMVAALRVLFGVELAPDALARASAVILVGVPSMYALASLFAAFVLKFGEIGPTVQFVRGALVLLAGITYPLAMLPDWARSVSSAVPTTYIVEDVRRVLLAGTEMPVVAQDLALLAGMAVAIALIATVTYGWIERDARRTGALSRY